MFSSDDQGGVAVCLIGLVGVVFAAIGISLLADLSGSDNRSKAEIRDDIRRDYEKFRAVEARLQRQRAKLATVTAHEHSSKAFTELQAIATSLQTQLDLARGTHTELSQEIERASEALADHRHRYRQQIRGAAVGEQLEELRLTNGKLFKDVTIRGHDEFGLRIHHQHGSARVRFDEMPPDWRERLHWSPEELLAANEKVAREEEAQLAQAVVPDEPDEPGRPTETRPKPTRKPSVDPQALAAAREQMILTRSRFARASQEARRARAMSYGANKSVPGSLETWADRAERLSVTEERARVAHDRAKLSLRSLSPYDPLLQDSIYE